MRITSLTTAFLAAVLIAFPDGAGSRSSMDGSSTRVINVSAREGTAHEHLTLALGKAAIVQLDTDARDVLVSSPTIVDAVVKTSRRVYLLGLKTGQTNAFFFDAAGHQILSLDIPVERDVADLTSMMHANFPGSEIHATAMNDNVVLTGSVDRGPEGTPAPDIAGRVAAAE